MDFSQKLKDNATYSAFVNLFGYGSRHDNKIDFYDFDINNQAHINILVIAINCQTIYNYKVFVNISFFKYLKLKYIKKFRTIKRTKSIDGISMNEFIDYMETDYKAEGIFKEIHV